MTEIPKVIQNIRFQNEEKGKLRASKVREGLYLIKREGKSGKLGEQMKKKGGYSPSNYVRETISIVGS